MKIDPFKLANLVKCNEKQFDLVLGQEYFYNMETVKLERIAFIPSFEIRRRWFRKDEVVPSYRLEAILSATYKNSIVSARVFGVPLEKFVTNLQPYYSFENELKNQVNKLEQSTEE